MAKMKEAKGRKGVDVGSKKMPDVAKPASAPVLPWMRCPITIQAGSGTPLDAIGGLDGSVKQVLQSSLHYPELFSVQSVVWRELAGGASTAHDLCIAAPTGSGKTLAYALPVITGIARCRNGTNASYHCLRALVVLPTRDLASQVHELFSALCPALGITTALVAARFTQAAEATQLVGPEGSIGGGADVAVVTPGRLVSHLQDTAGFTLRHLRFLVVDEADRLLRQSYQDWLPVVLQHLAGHDSSSTSTQIGGVGGATSLMPYAQDRVVKLVVSATLSRDPSKLARLDLHCPRYVTTSAEDHRYHLPRSLSEFKVLCSAARKPLLLLALLTTELAGQSTLVFTSSLDMTHKLFLMLQAVSCLDGGLGPNTVVEFSSLLTPAQRMRNLQAFKAGQAHVLVASDAMTRGMDVQGVQNVVNYDTPVYAKTYVHRAGRTARAGRTGRVITLLRDEDMRHFKAMLRKADNNFVANLRVAPELVESLRPVMDGALGQVQALLEAERQQAHAQLQHPQAQPRQPQQQQQAGQQPSRPSRDAQQLPKVKTSTATALQGSNPGTHTHASGGDVHSDMQEDVRSDDEGAGGSGHGTADAGEGHRSEEDEDEQAQPSSQEQEAERAARQHQHASTSLAAHTTATKHEVDAPAGRRKEEKKRKKRKTGRAEDEVGEENEVSVLAANGVQVKRWAKERGVPDGERDTGAVTDRQQRGIKRTKRGS